MSAVEDFIAAFKGSPEGTRQVFDSLRLRAQRERDGSAVWEPFAPGDRRPRGRPPEAATQLEWATVSGHPFHPLPESKHRVARRWVEPLAPEVLGVELPRQAQVRRASARRVRRRQRELITP